MEDINTKVENICFVVAVVVFGSSNTDRLFLSLCSRLTLKSAPGTIWGAKSWDGQPGLATYKASYTVLPVPRLQSFDSDQEKNST